MATLSDIRGYIKSELDIQNTEYDSDIDRAIRTAVQNEKGNRMWFLQKFTTITLLTDTSSVMLPSDFGSLQLARILVSGTYYSPGRGFDQRSFKELQSVYRRDVQSGVPANYAIIDGTLYTDSTAQNDYTIELTYWSEDAALPVSDSETSVWLGREGEHYILASTKVILGQSHRAFTLAQSDIIRRDEQLRNLRVSNNLYAGE